MDVIPLEFKTGDVIADRYRVRRVLGRGGMGVVYLVVDLETVEQRALKTLLPEYVENQVAIRRFAREVETARRLDHPAIVKIHEARRVGNLLFYTMDYIEGKSLRQWLEERGKLGLGSTVRILALLADALEYAHQFTVHRDISPENVMVLSDGSVRLLDFGLAKLVDNQGAFTMIGASLGKMHYKAPEQHLDATHVDGRADLYSLGVMFHALLTGKFPKRGVPITSLVPGLPEECNTFFEKATALRPDDRFANAREFREALMRVYEAGREHRNEPLPEGATSVRDQTSRPSVIRRVVSRTSAIWTRLSSWRPGGVRVRTIRKKQE